MNRFTIAWMTGFLSLVGFAGSSAQTTQPATRPVSATQPVIAVRAAQTMDLSVASYNILGGREKAKVLANIRSANPDIVLLQEAPLEVVREYARQLNMDFDFGPYLPRSDSGLAILTRGKIEPIKLFFMAKERNFALAGEVTIRGEKIFVVCVHLKSLPRPVSSGVFKVMKPHTEQAKTILAEVKKQKLPVLVGGDCNALSFSPEYMTFASQLRDCATATPAATQPTIFVGDVGYRIDYLFTRGPWYVQSCRVNSESGSDHRMIHCRLKLKCSGD
jgi:endonuclease/exonuclease/phosphatase (EEP) superfamily protein YafD